MPEIQLFGFTCQKNYFLCEDHMCIPDNWVCDGAEDCFNGLDEHNCTAEKPVKKWIK